MKRFVCTLRLAGILGIALSFSPARSAAQTAASYVFSSASGTYTPVTGGTLLSSGATMDDASFSVAIPSFTFLGTAYTQVWASENGFLQFGATSPTGGMRTGYISTTDAAARTGISAFCRDLAGKAGSSLRTQTIGSEVIFQWTNLANFLSTAQNYTFQIRLNTSTNEIRVVYNTLTVTAASASPNQVGLRGSITDFNNRTSTSSWAASAAGTLNTASMTVSPTVAPASGLNYIWNPPPPCNSRPAGGIAASAAGATAICPGATANLSVTGATITVSGLTYAWDSSLVSSGGPWSPVPGATATTYTAAPSACKTVYYRRRTICAAASLSDTSKSVSVTTKCAVIPPYSETFESITAANQFPNCMSATARVETQINPTGFANQINHTPGGSKYASFLFSANDYLFTPGIQLTAGKTYEFTFWYVTDGVAGWDSLSLNYGTAPNAAAMTTKLLPRLSNLTNTAYRKYTVRFVATSSAVQYFGINCISKLAPNRLTIDDIGLQEVPPCGGKPLTGAPTVLPARICSSGPAELDLPSMPPALGLTYEWQDSSVGSRWSNAPGRPSFGGNTLPFTTGAFGINTWFRCIVRCSLTGDSAISPSVLVPTGPYDLPYFENFESIDAPNTLPICMSATSLGTLVQSQVAPGTLGRSNHTPGGSKYAFFRWSCNDYIFTPAMRLIAGVQYIFSFWYVNDGLSGWTTLNVKYGNDATAAAMTSTLRTVSNAKNTTFVRYADTFSVSKSGIYNFGIYCNATGVPFYMSIDDIGVQYRPCSGMPVAGTIDGSVPSGTGVCPGTFITLKAIGATSSAITGIIYQWQRTPSGTGSWTDIAGATDSTLASDTLGGYDYRIRVVCSNSHDTNLSGIYSIPQFTPHPPVSISPSASPVIFCLGDTVKLSASNFPGGVYDWIKDGAPVPGWKFSDFSATSSGKYKVIVTSPVSPCPATSNEVELRQADPGFTVNLITPKDSFGCEGDSLVLTGASKPGVIYQWRRNNVPIPGATGTSVNVTTSGTYALTADDGTAPCKALSRSIYVSINPKPVAVITIPGGITTACENEGVRLDANPVPSFSYQWQRYGTPVFGSTDSSLIVRNSGTYSVKVRSREGCVNTSAAVNITILPSPKPLITQTSYTLNTLFGFVSYKWFRNGTEMPGRTADTLNLTLNGSYKLFVTDTNGCTGESNTITVNDSTLGLSRFDLSQTVQIYPNPVSGKLHIECPVPFEAELSDLLGRSVMQGIREAETDCSSLPDGVYLLTLKEKDQEILLKQKIVKHSR
ncbi:MAG: choice-of-anchor J domain-containing protein [Chitinophagaceae bacterium]